MYSIGQVSKFLNVSRDTLKFYEEKGLVKPKKNTSNSYRTYSHYDIHDILVTNYYRELDIEIKKIQEIRQSKSVDGVIKLIEEKEQLVKKEIAYKQFLLKQLNKAKENSQKVADNLNVFSIIPMPKFVVKGEMADVFSFDDYDVLKTHTDNSKKAVTLSKLMRIINFDANGINSSRFAVVKETQLNEDDTEEEIISHDKCLYAVVESGRWISKEMHADNPDDNSGNDDGKIGELIRSAAQKNNCTLLGRVYVSTVLTTYEDGLERIFYDIYTPIA